MKSERAKIYIEKKNNLHSFRSNGWFVQRSDSFSATTEPFSLEIIWINDKTSDLLTKMILSQVDTVVGTALGTAVATEVDTAITLDKFDSVLFR